MRKLLTISLIAAGAILVTMCGESPEITLPPNPGTGNNGTGALTDDQRLELLDACSEFVNTLGDLKSEAEQQVVVNWLKSHAEFADAGILDGNVWAYFHDGRAVMIVPNWWGSGDLNGGRVEVPLDGERKNRTTETTRIEGQPGSNQAKLFFGLGKGFRDYRASLQALFKKSNTKYEPVLEEMSIENLKNTKDVGIVYFNTHGGMGRRKPVETEPGAFFGLWTTDSITKANEEKYRVDLDEHLLCYMLAVHNVPVNEWHYAITEKFVRYSFFLTLSENVLIYVDACNGMTANAKSFREAMIKKAKGEKATYVGWTGPTSAIDAAPPAHIVFDRMLGTNTPITADEGIIDAPDPVQRPFDLSDIFNDMQHYEVNDLPLGVAYNGSRLAYYARNTSDIIIRPSIEYMGIDENESRLYIKGIFGDAFPSDATVSVGGVAVPVIFWGTDLIICEIPTTGPGSTGDVVVSIRGNKSNVVPLTEWIIPVDVTAEETGAKLEAHLELRLRADVHRYRSKPGEAPKAIRPDTLGILADPNAVGFPFAIGSKGTFNVGGGWFSTCRQEKCEITNSFSASARNGVLRYASFDTNDPRFRAFYKWSEDMGTIFLTLYVYVPNVGFQTEYRMLCDGQPGPESSQSLNQELNVETHIDLPVLKLQLDGNYRIQRNGYSKFEDVEWEACRKKERIGVSVSSSEADPAFPPTRDTQARVSRGSE